MYDNGETDLMNPWPRVLAENDGKVAPYPIDDREAPSWWTRFLSEVK